MTDYGGIARVVSLKANYFVSVFNYEVDIIAPNPKNVSFFYNFNPKIKWHNSINFQKSILYLWNYIAFIKRTITEKKPDVIIICDAPHWILIPWFLKNNIPIVFETHFSTSFKLVKSKSLFSSLRFKLVYFLKKKTLQQFDKTVYETYAGSKEWNAENSEVIPNPISFVSENKTELHNKRAIAVCRHSYEKGLDRLLFIWKEVVKKHPDWKLDIYGQWDDTMLFHKMAAKMEISKNINFIAVTKDIKSCLEQSSIFLMTSRSEAFGMVLIEAMTCGLPTVVYDCPCGPREIVTNNQDGFLIEDDNMDLFIDKVMLLIESQDLRIEFGHKAKINTQKYNSQAVMQTWKNLLESLF
jgi:glycosyltransferase involved in cell wall biosynthesis